jgi:hypothetical protein
MKTYKIEMHKVKAMSHGNGLIQAKIDALVLPVTVRDDQPETTLLSMSEETARVMLLLLKAQLAEVDGKKARSQRSRWLTPTMPLLQPPPGGGSSAMDEPALGAGELRRSDVGVALCQQRPQHRAVAAPLVIAVATQREVRALR